MRLAGNHVKGGPISCPKAAGIEATSPFIPPTKEHLLHNCTFFIFIYFCSKKVLTLDYYPDGIHWPDVCLGQNLSSIVFAFLTVKPHNCIFAMDCTCVCSDKERMESAHEDHLPPLNPFRRLANTHTLSRADNHFAHECRTEGPSMLSEGVRNDSTRPNI